jgi:accessory gene regulator B
MVERMALNIVEQMERREIIEKIYCEYYTYVLITTVENIVTVSTMLLISLLFKQFMYTICFIFFFISLRRHTGGFHTNKFFQCYFGTIIIHIFILQFSYILCKNFAIMYVLLFLATISIWIMGTINHPNMNMDKKELQESKKVARLLVLMEVAVIIVLTFLQVGIMYIYNMSMAVILCALLMCVSKILKQEVSRK